MGQYTSITTLYVATISYITTHLFYQSPTKNPPKKGAGCLFLSLRFNNLGWSTLSVQCHPHAAFSHM
jgi:hypothetical protein